MRKNFRFKPPMSKVKQEIVVEDGQVILYGAFQTSNE